MSEQPEGVVRQFLQAFDRQDWSTWTALAHPDHKFHFPLAPQTLDRDGHRGL